MLDFLHRLLRRIVSRENLPEENDWDALLGFEFVDAQLLTVFQFMEKIKFRTKAMRAAKGRINVANEKSKRLLCKWTTVLKLSMTCVSFIWMKSILDRRSKIWSHSCLQVQNCSNENRLCTFSKCVVCVWGILYRSCQMCHWVRLIEVVVRLIWQMSLGLSKVTYWSPMRNITSFRVPIRFTPVLRC